jgi:hypothetical protein
LHGVRPLLLLLRRRRLQLLLVRDVPTAPQEACVFPLADEARMLALKAARRPSPDGFRADPCQLAPSPGDFQSSRGGRIRLSI